jgi:simple sugar transport system permease protein
MALNEQAVSKDTKQTRHPLRLIPILEPRQTVSEMRRLSVYVISLTVAAVLSVALLALSGVAPADLFSEISNTAFSSPRALGAVLALMAPLVVAGLASAIAFRANFWNIGVEGQMILGAIFATAIAIFDVGPEATRLPLMAIAAALGGMLWIAGPGFLKNRLGVNEVITTLLLNYVAFNLLLHLLYGGWKDPVSSFPHSEQYEAFERLPQLGWQNLTWALPLSGIFALALWWLYSSSRFGYFLDFLSSNRDMARAMGLPVAGLSLAAILGSGAAAGLTGFVISAGIEGRMTQDFHTGYLFNGVLIAFIARNHPIGVLVTAFFMAVLIQLGQSLQVFFGTPFSVVRLTQAIFIICVAASEFFLTYRMHWRSAS